MSNPFEDILPPKVRKAMNLGYFAAVSSMATWAIVVANIPGASLPNYYNGIMAGLLAIGGYLGLQSASNVNTKETSVE